MRPCVICRSASVLSPSVDFRQILCSAHCEEWRDSPECKRALGGRETIPKTPLAETMLADFIRRMQAERLNRSTKMKGKG